jgi:hypothetical protein
MKALRAILGVAVIVAVLYAMWMLVPPYFHNYQLQDTIADEARMNTYTAKSEEDMRETIWRKAKDLEIPITREQINVRREGQSVAIWIDYTVHVDMPIYPVDLQFHSSSKNKSF